LPDHVHWPRFVADYRIGVEPDPPPVEASWGGAPRCRRRRHRPLPTQPSAATRHARTHPVPARVAPGIAACGCLRVPARACTSTTQRAARPVTRSKARAAAAAARSAALGHHEQRRAHDHGRLAESAHAVCSGTSGTSVSYPSTRLRTPTRRLRRGRPHGTPAARAPLRAGPKPAGRCAGDAGTIARGAHHRRRPMACSVMAQRRRPSGNTSRRHSRRGVRRSIRAADDPRPAGR
jgi:hypothetical protein